MKLYNTLTRQIDEITPQQPPTVTMYTCGPTVYDYSHIGHWFNYIRMDMLIRTLKASDLQPIWVMNITDVGHLVSDADDGEDKLEKGARREGKTAWEVAEFYTADFLECLDILQITKPTQIVKATDHIDEQIALIQTLEEKGYAYVIDDGVYYDTAQFEGYKAFARLDLDEQQAGARVIFNKQKRNSSDFALWKFSPKDSQRDMEWNRPWGKGFPGWHIECSAMSMKYLGDTLDIHTGGIDHIPVHHTNEIAQSEAATGKRFANYWMHSNHVMVEGEKISKSLGNGIRLQNIISKGYTAETVRLYALESNYRTHSQFSWDGLDAAKNRMNGYRAMAALRYQIKNVTPQTPEVFGEAKKAIHENLCNDLNTPIALASLSSFTDMYADKLLSSENIQDFEEYLGFIDDMMGLNLSSVKDITDDQKQLLEAREQARAAKEWDKSDVIRGQLAGQGVGIRDTEHGPIWFPL